MKSASSSDQSAISLAEAKRRLKAGIPLCNQRIRCTMRQAASVGGFLPAPEESFETCKVWVVEAFPPEAVLARKYNDKGLTLRAEMIPRPTQGTSLKRLLPKSKWDEIRLNALRASGNRCAVCGSSRGLSCHEVWAFDDAAGIQKLIRLEPRCAMCHFVEHLGLAQTLAKEGQLDFNAVIRHFCTINKCNVNHFRVHEMRAFKIWRERSRKDWRVDFGLYRSLLPKGSEGPYKECKLVMKLIGRATSKRSG